VGIVLAGVPAGAINPRVAGLGNTRYPSWVAGEREMCPWAISKYFGDLVSNTSA
jgi:hypothetical protein